MKTSRSDLDSRTPNQRRLFSEHELTELAMHPVAEVRMKLEQGNPNATLALVVELDQSWRAYYGRLGQRISATIGLYRRRFGSEAKSRMLAALNNFAEVYRAVDQATLEQRGLCRQVTDNIDKGDSAAALIAYTRMEHHWRRLIDYRRDRYSALLSYVYRTHGVDELEIMHRFAGKRALANLTLDIEQPAQVRLIAFARFLRTIFSTIQIAEYDDRFAITQQVCGTCGRQILDGRYGAPFNLAIVKERHPITWHRGDTPIYRTHVPVWHVAMARERIGVPWPVNQCPSGLEAGPCEILLFKNPRDAAANEAVPA